ncbi:MAG TPA: AraC family transcriptional regulator, partial [Burkholderiales bacterium]|nr:AraC family transcriptional regulator [Burkholderiales bacterium]
GRLILQVAGEPPLELRGGAIVLLPRNDAHTLASQEGLKPIGGDQLPHEDTGVGPIRIRYGGGGERTHIVCGLLGTDSRNHPLLDTLPPTLVLDLKGDPACEWIARSFRYAAGELAAVRAGSGIALSKLSELLFVEAVRRYLDTLPADRRGWLAGLRDPVVARALALLHTHLARGWTTEALAQEVGASRSAFAERFTALMGLPPMRYLTGWRMQVATERLRDTRRSVAQIAAEVGYESEIAFARAFKREFSASPAQWRKQPLKS